MKAMRLKIALVAACVATVSLAAKMPLSDARAKIGSCIQSPSEMASTIKSLSAADQLTFLREVNEAIEKMPGSVEAKTARFLNINRAAVTSAGAGNRTKMIAEVFATVPPVALTVINERFASDLLNKDADPSRPVSDAQFKRIAENIMREVNARCASEENGAERSAFAVLMLVRASNDSIPGLADDLIATLPADAQNIARAEWVPSALGVNQVKDYEPILGNVDHDGKLPENRVVLRLAGPQLLESMLGDVVEGVPLINRSNDPFIDYGGGVRSSEFVPEPVVPVPSEPGGYQGQYIGF